MNKLFAILCVLSFLSITAPSRADDGSFGLYIGKPELNQNEAGNYWVLKGPSDSVNYFIGTDKNIKAKNQALSACLANAAKSEFENVRITGNLDPEKGPIDVAALKCEFPVKKDDCPKKVLGKRTVTGYYTGTECGDFCYLYLITSCGQLFDPYADPDEVEALFGKEPGKRVSVTVEVGQEWMPESLENPDGPGFCQTYELFKSGKILD